MPLHEAGLGLNPSRAPIGGVPQIRETDTGAAAARARVPAQPRQRTPGVPQFETDPIGAISFALREVGAALQGNELPSERAKAAAFEQMGARMKLTKGRLNALKTALDMIAKVDSNQVEVIIEAIVRAAPDLDLGEALRAFAEGGFKNMQATVEAAINNPLFQAFVANTPEFDNLPFEQKVKMTEDFNEFKSKLTAKLLEQEALREGEVKKARETTAAQREPIPEAAKRAGEIEKAKAAERPRKLGPDRTVEPTQDIIFNGGIIPKGVPISVQTVEGESFSVTSVPIGGEMVEIKIPNAILPKVIRQRELKSPTASQIGEIKQRVAFLDDAVSNTEKLIAIITGKTPTGAALELTSVVQGTLDQLFTLAESVPGAGGLVGMARNAAAFLNDRLGDAPEDKEFKEQYGLKLADPNIPVIDILEEAIAIALAASSFPSTQRVPVEAIKKARENVDIGGLFGPGRETAKAKLFAIIERLKSNRAALAGVVGGLTEPAIKTGPARFRVEGGKLVPVP